ncbi:MAG: hypothetical protein J0M20_12330 [Burkholderiales bacterium]|nr:hypothetical protein [Burkholderiales bacterium]
MATQQNFRPISTFDIGIMPLRVLTGLTVALLAAAGLTIRLLDPERLSALGGILSGIGSILAVLWFSAGLNYQARQLREQQQQFAAQFAFLRESSRRDALLLAQGILEKAEAKALANFEPGTTMADLPAKYIGLVELKPILESTNPRAVLDAFQPYMKKEGAAIALLQGIKSAAEVYLRSVGANDIDYSKAPEEFYFVYSPRFANEAFFNTVAGSATIHSEIMLRFKPARDAALIAYFAATAKMISRDVIKMEKLKEDMQKHVAAGYPLPAVATDV